MQPQITDPRLLLLQSDHALYDDFIPQEDKSCCTREKIKRMAMIGLGGVGVISSGVFLAQQLLKNHPDPKVVILTTCVSGIAAAIMLHPIPSHETRTFMYNKLSELSYPLLFAVAQLPINVLHKNSQAKLYELAVTGFGAWFGFFLGNDMAHALSLTVGDFSLRTTPPKEGDELVMLGFSPRNNKIMWLLTVPALSIMSVAGNVLYQIHKTELASGSLGDLQKIGFFQDLVAMFTGGVVGLSVSHLMDTWKEALEERRAQQLLPSREAYCCNKLNMLRAVKTLFVVSSSFFSIALLAYPTPANTWLRYSFKAAAGSIVIANLNLARREFTNLQIPLKKKEESISSCFERTKNLAKKYLPTISLFGLLSADMIYQTVIEPHISVRIGIATLITGTVVGIGATVATQRAFRVKQNSRIINELAFHLLYCQVIVAFIYQYLTTIISIGDKNLKTDHIALYYLALFTWFDWGVGGGNTLARIGQKKINPLSGITQPITMQELSKTMVKTLTSPQ